MTEGQPKPDITRRQLLRGTIETGAGLIIGGLSWKDFHNTIEMQKEQRVKANWEVKHKGISQPTQDELNTMNQLRNEIVARPFEVRNPEQLQQAQQTFHRQERYNEEHRSTLRKIQNHEGDHNLRKWAGSIGAVAGGATSLWGMLNLGSVAIYETAKAWLAREMRNRQK